MLPEQYLERVRPLRDPCEIEGVCRELEKELFGDRTYAAKTQANKLTPYNKVINTIPNEDLVEGQNAYIHEKEDGTLWKRHLHFQFLGLKKEQWRQINSKSNVLDRLENRRRIDVEKYLEATIKLLQSDDPHELAVGLIGSSGRRPIEILVRGNFEITKELPEYLRHGYFVNFRGQAKKRDYDMPEDERIDYRIGVLVPAHFFLDCFNKFRKMPESQEILNYLRKETEKGISPEDINDSIESKRGNSLRRVVQREYTFLPIRFGDRNLDNKSLRAAYLRLITERDCPKNIDELLWASRAVGHFVENEKPDDSQLRHLSTTLGYSDYYADMEVPFVSAPQKEQKEKLANVRAALSDFEIIKQMQDKWDLLNQQSVIRFLIEKAGHNEELERQIIEKEAENQQLKDENEKLKKELQEMVESLKPDLNAQTMEEIQNPQDLQKMIRAIIVEELKKISPQPVSDAIAQPATPVEENSTQQPQTDWKTKEQKTERDWSTASNEELWASKARGATDERILRAFQAVCDYNNYVATSNDERWYIGSVTLRNLTNCNGTLVSDWIERHKLSVDDHNNSYGLGQYHNKRHKGKSISDVITLVKKDQAQQHDNYSASSYE